MLQEGFLKLLTSVEPVCYKYGCYAIEQQTKEPASDDFSSNLPFPSTLPTSHLRCKLLSRAIENLSHNIYSFYCGDVCKILLVDKLRISTDETNLVTSQYQPRVNMKPSKKRRNKGMSWEPNMLVY